MASNREIIEVLHFVGANERFISREFERHFLGLGVRAGLMGAAAAAIAFLMLPLMMHVLGGGIVTDRRNPKADRLRRARSQGLFPVRAGGVRGGLFVHDHLQARRNPRAQDLFVRRPPPPGATGRKAGFQARAICAYSAPAW